MRRLFAVCVLVVVGCAHHPGPMVTAPLAPLWPFVPPPAGEWETPTPEKLPYCGEGHSEYGKTPALWDDPCYIKATLDRSSLKLRVTPLRSTAARQDVRVVVIADGGDALLVGIAGILFERASAQPLHHRQTVVEWRAVPEGVYVVYAILSERGRAVARAEQDVCYGNQEDCG